MEEKNDAGNADTKPADTRAGGPDSTRTGTEREEASPEEQDNIPRGAPANSRSDSR